jgi:hypothetical protein
MAHAAASSRGRAAATVESHSPADADGPSKSEATTPLPSAAGPTSRGRCLSGVASDAGRDLRAGLETAGRDHRAALETASGDFRAGLQTGLLGIAGSVVVYSLVWAAVTLRRGGGNATLRRVRGAKKQLQ